MESSKVDMFLMTNGKYLPAAQMPEVRSRLLAIDDGKGSVVQSMQLKDPSTILIVSILAGSLGLDRFLIGDTGMGVGKLLTCGGFGIWTIVDWFNIQGRTREKNLEKIRPFLY